MTNSSNTFENDSKLNSISPSEEFEAEINQHCTLDSIAALSGGIAHDYNNLLTAIIGNIHNIVMNAREAMPDGDRLNIVAANTAATDDMASLAAGKYVKISITDQGRGIAAEEFDKIFAPYYSTKDMGCRKDMGLGLIICHSIIT
jgi:signal transduction histidine kinase